MKVIEIITEGGWASTLTQSTRITPPLVKKMVRVYHQFIGQFNKFLSARQVPNVQAGNPVGSSFYYEQDLIDNPEKEYGDIDIGFIIPRIDDMSESRNESMYAELVKEFVDQMPNISSDNGVNVIFKMGNDAVQIDLVSIFGPNVHWARALIPERGIKGVISSSLYSSLGELLNLSISSRGVQIKLRNNHPVSFRQSKDVELKTVSLSPDRWAVDILNFFYRLQGRKEQPKITTELKKHSGINVEDIRIRDIAAAIKALGQSLEVNGMFEQVGLEGVKNYKDYLNKIKQIFTAKLQAKINDPKFAKANTPDAIAKANSDRKKIADGLKLTLSFL